MAYLMALIAFLSFMLTFPVAEALKEKREVRRLVDAKKANEFLHREFGKSAAQFADVHGLKDEKKALELYAALSGTGNVELTTTEIKILAKANEIIQRPERKIAFDNPDLRDAFKDEVRMLAARRELDKLLAGTTADSISEEFSVSDLEREFRQIAQEQARRT
jgi:hypothetical protein